jgi:Fe-S cluster assembly ATP-binding protein
MAALLGGPALAPHSACFAARRCRRAARATPRAASAAAAPLLEVRDLHAKVSGTDKAILNGLSLTIREGEVHAIMGKNGSGKSTLSKVLVGHPAYEVTGGSVLFKGKDLLSLEPEARAHAGLFLSFQSPVEIPGVRCVLQRGMAELGLLERCGARRSASGAACKRPNPNEV